MKRSIRGTLDKIMLLSASIALFVMGTLTGAMEYRDARLTFTHELALHADIAAQSCEAPLAFADRAAALKALETLSTIPGFLAAALYDKNGSLFASFVADGAQLPKVVGSGKTVEFKLGRAEVKRPIVLDGEEIGEILIQCDTRGIEGRLQRSLTVLAGALSIALLVVWGLMRRLGRQVTSPILELAEMMRDIANRGTFSFRSTQDRDDEIGVLVSGFNDMLDKLHRRDEELARHRTNLESMVEQRTSELAEANERLAAELEQRVQAESALVRAAEEWAGTFDAIDDLIVVFDAQGRVTRCNRAMGHQVRTDIIGYEIESVAEQHIGIDAVTLARHRSTPSRETIRAGARWLEINVSHILAQSGESGGGVLVVSDVTRERELLDGFNQAQKMEAIGRLAGGVAHDFNNILSIILSYASFLLSSLPEGSDDRDNAFEIKEAATRGTALTRQLLAFSRKQAVNPVILKVAEVVSNVSKMIRTLVGEHITVTVTLPTESGKVFMDQSQLDQILINVAANARDAMPSGGSFSIQVDVLESAPSDVPPREGGYVRIACRDTGTGIPESIKARIFEPFFTTKPSGKGTGLGLAMVYGAVQQAQGILTVDSRVGQGTTINIYLPRIHSATPHVGSKARPVMTKAGRGLILLVEDDRPLRRAIRFILEDGGYQVLEAENGAEGFEKFKASDHVALVLSDIVMPGTGGLAMGRMISEASPKTPILFMSGYSDDAMAADAGPPPPHLISKPFDGGVLLDRIQALLEEGRSMISGLSTGKTSLL